MSPLTTLWLAGAFSLSAATPASTDYRVQTADGRAIGSSETRGKVVVLTWWATWCAPCRQELADFDAYYRRHRDEGLEIIALDADMHDVGYRFRPPAAHPAFPIAVTLNGAAFPLEGVPTTYVLDRRGRLVMVRHGTLPRARMQALLGRLLRDK